jgi:hypothetical protein
MPECSNCHASCLDDDRHKGRFYLSTVSTVWSEADEFRDFLCSIDCLLAFAWRIKESQPKLSKSKEYAPIVTLGPLAQGNGPFGD